LLVKVFRAPFASAKQIHPAKIRLNPPVRLGLISRKDQPFAFVHVRVKFVLVLIAALSSLSAENQPLRVLCWNLHHGVGEDGKLDLQRIADVIKAAKPDLVALQEVDNQCARSGKVDQAAELARLTGLNGVFGKAMDFQGGGYGQAILSRHPIGETKVHALPGKGEPRIAFEAIVTIGEKTNRFVSVHLDLDAAQRLEQARTLANILSTNQEPVILCGDFNDGPSSPALKEISHALKPVPKKPPVLTCPAGKPTEEIDHMLVNQWVPASEMVVLPEAVASDHRPLLAELHRK